MALSGVLFFFFFFISGLSSIAVGRSYVHLGPRGTETTATLRARVVANAVKPVPRQGFESEFGAAEGFTFEDDDEGEQVVVDFEAEIAKDVIIWEELEEAGISILSCSRDPETLKASIVLSGDNLNVTDYQNGTAFAIGSDSWEEYCGAVEEVEGIDPSDDYLFYVIDDSIAQEEQVSLNMTIVPGSEVVPEVELNVIPDANARMMPKGMVFEDDSSLSSSSRILAGFGNNTLPTLVRPTVSGSGTVQLFDGATLSVAASLRADIKSFKVRRSWRLKVEWTQILEANFDASLVVDLKELSGRRSGDIFRKPVPGFGFSKKIWLVGRVRAGAFVILQWLVELDLNGGLDASVSASYQSHRRVKAQLIPPKLESSNLAPPQQGSSGSSAIDFTKTVDLDDPRFTGFAGLRPALGLEATLRGKGIGGNIGASIGLEAKGIARKPPFLPFSGSGRTVGSCSDCHYFRGSAAVVGKDLGLQLEKNGQPKTPKILIENLFRIPLGTLCAFKGTCPSATPSVSPTPSQSMLPSPTPSVSPSASASISPAPPTPSPSSSMSLSPTPSVSPSASASISPSPSSSPSAIPSQSSSPSAIPSQSSSPSAIPSQSSSPSAIPSQSSSPSAIPSQSSSPSAIPSQSSSPSAIPSQSSSPSAIPSQSSSPSAIPSQSSSPSAIPSQSSSPSAIPSQSSSPSAIPSQSSSPSAIPSQSSSPSPIPSPSQTPSPSPIPEFDSNGCRTCSSTRPCSSGLSCVNNSCKKLISFGAVCESCSSCNGFCFGGRCVPELGGLGGAFGFRNGEDMMEASPFPEMEDEELTFTPGPVGVF